MRKINEEILNDVLKQFGQWEIDNVKVKNMPFISDIVYYVINRTLSETKNKKVIT